MKAGIGTGKTYMMLLKIVIFCQENPNSVAMIVRKEYTDLRDSTIIDFKRYFGVEPNTARDVNFENGSKIMFRHAGEIGKDNLKNMTLDIVGIEQAEELQDQESFSFIRDRMRGKNCPIYGEDGTTVVDYFQQIVLIANANGHNWIWRLWKYQPESDQFHLIEATTFDNEKNLPISFVKDMRSREKSEPRHFARMCMNSDDEELTDDNVFKSSDLTRSSNLGFVLPNFVRYAAGLDVARFGTDTTCLTVLALVGNKRWKMVFQEEKHQWTAPQIVGWVKDMWETFPFGTIGVDDIGVGGGVKDYLDDSNKFTCYGFTANERPNGESVFPNKKSEAMFKLEEYISKDWLEITKDVKLHEEFMTVRFYYRGESKKYIVSKDELRSKGIKSPNKVDSTSLALYYADEDLIFNQDDIVVPGIGIPAKKMQEYQITTEN